MPRYEYQCCKEWEQYAGFDDRDSVRCSDCGKLAGRKMASFVFSGATYVGTDRFRGAEQALGAKNLESVRDVEAAMARAGAVPVDPYYRQPTPPPLKELTMKEIAPYLDGMPLK